MSYESDSEFTFIPAQESRTFIGIFRLFTLFFYKIRFRAVWVDQVYFPTPDDSTLYLSNHNSWWDGLTPLLLNEFLLKQRARAIMEDKQMRAYGFFKKIGAFSINRKNPREALKSLDYASDWLNNKGTSIFLYPEGKLVDSTVPIKIESGVIRIADNAPGTDIVPLLIHIHTLNGSKPEMFIKIGPKLTFPSKYKKAQATQFISEVLENQRKELILESAAKQHPFKKLV